MRAWPIVLAVLATGFAPAPFPRPDRGNGAARLRSLEGVWVVKAITRGDVECFSVAVGNDLMFVEEMRITISGSDFRQKPAFSVTWSVRVRGPGQFDLLNNGEGQARALGRYWRGGETLVLTFQASGKDRPTTSSSDNIQIVLTGVRR